MNSSDSHRHEVVSQPAIDLAVAGTRADVVALMAETGGWSVADLDPLIRSGVLLVGEDGAFCFADRQVRASIVAAASPVMVARAHARAARAATDLHLPLGQRIDHLRKSSLLADETVAQLLEDAALLAEQDDDLTQASAAWRAAARMSPSSPQRVARASRALRLIVIGGLDYAGEQELLDLLAGEQLSHDCACWVDWAKALQRSDEDPGSAVVAQWNTIRRARDLSPESMRALLWDAAMNAWTLGDAPAGMRAALEYVAVTQAEAAEGVEPPWTGLALLSAAHFEKGEVREAAELRSRAIEAARTVDSHCVPFDRLVSIVFLDDLLLDVSEEAGERLADCLQRAHPESSVAACMLGISAWRARASGDWARADELLGLGRPLAAATAATGAQRGMAALVVELAALRGRVEQLQAESRRLREQVTRHGDRRRRSTVDRAMGLHYLASGRIDDAVASLLAAADVPFLGRGLRDGVLTARVDLVEALLRRGDAASARQRADAVRPILLEMDQPLASALERRVSAVLLSGPEAVAAYADAVAWHRRVAEPFELGRTLLLLGEELRRSKQRGDARLHLLEAQALFEGLGAQPWLERARAELRAAGGRVEVGAAAGALTPQELAVAKAAASGLSTRELAESLFLSPRTVEFHLGNVYRKLGVKGRAALVARLQTD